MWQLLNFGNTAPAPTLGFLTNIFIILTRWNIPFCEKEAMKLFCLYVTYFSYGLCFPPLVSTYVNTLGLNIAVHIYSWFIYFFLQICLDTLPLFHEYIKCILLFFTLSTLGNKCGVKSEGKETHFETWNKWKLGLHLQLHVSVISENKVKTLSFILPVKNSLFARAETIIVA